MAMRGEEEEEREKSEIQFRKSMGEEEFKLKS
jgi:hypothetical protein